MTWFHVVVWFCYIDNILLIWSGPDGLLQTFVQQLNINTFNFTFTMTSNTNQIKFLDIYIHKDTNGILTSSLYRKPTAGNGILHATSFHPNNLVRSIPFGQYLHVRCNCSDKVTFKKEANELRSRLLAQGYSKIFLKKAFRKATSKTRQKLLYGMKDQNNNSNQIRIITSFSNQQEHFRNIVHKYWYVLALDPTVGPLLPKRPAFTFRRAISLRDKLFSSEYRVGVRDPCTICRHV